MFTFEYLNNFYGSYWKRHYFASIFSCSKWKGILETAPIGFGENSTHPYSSCHLNHIRSDRIVPSLSIPWMRRFKVYPHDSLLRLWRKMFQNPRRKEVRGRGPLSSAGSRAVISSLRGYGMSDTFSWSTLALRRFRIVIESWGQTVLSRSVSPFSFNVVLEYLKGKKQSWGHTL